MTKQKYVRTRKLVHAFTLRFKKKKKACKPHLLNHLITVSVSFINIIFASSNKQGVSMQVIIYLHPSFPNTLYKQPPLKLPFL